MATRLSASRRRGRGPWGTSHWIAGGAALIVTATLIQSSNTPDAAAAPTATPKTGTVAVDEGETRYNRTAMVRGIQGGTVNIAQPGYAPLSSLTEILARNRFEEIAALRPRSR